MLTEEEKVAVLTEAHADKGLDERTNQTIKVSIGKTIRAQQERWEDNLREIVYAHNTWVQASTRGPRKDTYQRRMMRGVKRFIITPGMEVLKKDERKEEGVPWTQIGAKLPPAKNIRIVANCYIQCGEESALETMGISLGLDARVPLFGWGGLTWDRHLHFVHLSLRGRAAPDVLLIHCGGND
ncbi:hypothetical protein COCON_G00130640 [Conger conger]|uniref:Uncharacterized protein n=1 Tax=Conger conger TaxID=82655 RepID=A0A9Q1DDS8_CONCO|nr:hypothetical protein COCON_G00130640 [Conger conger]